MIRFVPPKDAGEGADTNPKAAASPALRACLGSIQWPRLRLGLSQPKVGQTRDHKGDKERVDEG